MKILITLCARGGSKGIPGKNIRMLAGKPLIGYSIDIATQLSMEMDVDVALSTDSKEIREVAFKFGIASEYLRPEFLASDTAGKIDTIIDLISYTENQRSCKYDFILDLDITSPLRTIDDLKESLNLLLADKDALNIYSVNHASRNPYFNMVEKQDSGYYGLVKRGSDGAVMTRQTAPPVFELNASFYWYRRAFFENGYKSPINEKSLIYVMPHICFDLDHPIDFEFMEYLVNENKLDFKF